MFRKIKQGVACFLVVLMVIGNLPQQIRPAYASQIQQTLEGEDIGGQPAISAEPGPLQIQESQIITPNVYLPVIHSNGRPPVSPYPQATKPPKMTQNIGAAFWNKAPHPAVGTGVNLVASLAITDQARAVLDHLHSVQPDMEPFSGTPMSSDPEQMPISAQGNVHVPLLDPEFNTCDGWILSQDAHCFNGRLILPPGDSAVQLISQNLYGWSEVTMFAYADLTISGGHGTLTLATTSITNNITKTCRKSWGDGGNTGFIQVEMLPCRAHAGAGSLWFILENPSGAQVEVTTGWADVWDNPQTLPSLAGTWNLYTVPGDGRGCVRQSSTDGWVCLSRLGLWLKTDQPGPNGNYETVVHQPWAMHEPGKPAGMAKPVDSQQRPWRSWKEGLKRPMRQPRKQGAVFTIVLVGGSLLIVGGATLLVLQHVQGQEARVPLNQLFGSNWFDRLQVHQASCQGEYCAHRIPETDVAFWVAEKAVATYYMTAYRPFAGKFEDNDFWNVVQASAESTVRSAADNLKNLSWMNRLPSGSYVQVWSNRPEVAAFDNLYICAAVKKPGLPLAFAIVKAKYLVSAASPGPEWVAHGILVNVWLSRNIISWESAFNPGTVGPFDDVRYFTAGVGEDYFTGMRTYLSCDVLMLSAPIP